MELSSNEISTKIVLETSNVHKIESFFENDAYYW